MDPNATLALLTAALAADDESGTYEAADALTAWLLQGGFAPAATADQWLMLLDAIRLAIDTDRHRFER